MKHHEREFFISTIRTGNTYVDNFIIRPPRIEQTIQASNVYQNAFSEAKDDGVMDEDEMLKWMITEGFWHKQNEIRIENLQKQIEDFKVELFKNFLDKKIVKNLRFGIRQLEQKLIEENKTKHDFFSNTCESFAALQRNNWLIRNTTYINDKLYDFEEDDLLYISQKFQQSILLETHIRELARNEPWRSLWGISQKINRKLFLNPDDCEITTNQKNLTIWSKLYDAINESVDCPHENIINDDDALDGWFIFQNRKREKEKKQNDIDMKLGSKNKSAQEVFVMTNKDSSHEIYDVNDPSSRTTIKNREKEVQEKGKIEHHKLQDQQLKILSKAKSKRGR